MFLIGFNGVLVCTHTHAHTSGYSVDFTPTQPGKLGLVVQGMVQSLALFHSSSLTVITSRVWLFVYCRSDFICWRVTAGERCQEKFRICTGFKPTMKRVVARN